jgi:MFS family permease
MRVAFLPVAGYAEVLAQPGMRRLVPAVLLGRLGASMWSLAIVLFALAELHSAVVAGLAAMLSLAPGLLVSPLAGAVLDRYGRPGLIALDYGVAAATGLLLAGLAAAHQLSAPVLVVVVTLGSLTVPLSAAGARSMFPALVPARLWDRLNSLDTGLLSIANITAPAAVGVLVAGAGARLTMVVIAGAWLVAAGLVVGVTAPAAPPRLGGVLADTLGGIRLVARNPVLRGIAASIPIQTFGRGISLVALPVLVIGSLHLGPAALGLLFSVQAVTALLSEVLAGGLESRGRERVYISAAMAVFALSVVLLAATRNYLLLVVLMAVGGLSAGPVEIPLFSLRQRSVDPAWLGRAIAISYSLNLLGTPLGSGLGGLLAARSPQLGLVVAGGLIGLSALLAYLLLPSWPHKEGP